MPEFTNKAALLTDINDAYTKFQALLAPLSEAQLITLGVNGTWSVKDNIAHLSAWHKVLLARLLAASNVAHSEDSTLGIDVDVLNEQFYLQNKTYPLSNVLIEFSTTYQQVIQALENLTDDQLTRSQAWLEGQPVLDFIAGDTIEHYQEHSQIIQAWLDRESRV